MGRQRINIDSETENRAKQILLDVVRENGGKAGNLTALSRFYDEAKKQLKENFADDVYWQIRNALIEEGKLERGRGKGGSVRLTEDVPTRQASTNKHYKKETELYEDFHKMVQTDWVQEYDITDFISEVSAHKGSKKPGGKWTRPDVTLVSVGKYEFIPGKTIEVITFEVKPANKYGVDGVYETASHSAFANKCYLALHMPDGSDDADSLDRLEREAQRFGVGLVTFEDPSDWKTFEVVVEAQHNTPSPTDMNGFLGRLDDDAKQKLRKLLH